VDVLAERVKGQTHRPLDERAAPQLAEQMRRRAAHFAEVADVVVDEGDRAPEELVAELLADLTRRR
jgi:shikimate kinase